MYDVSCKFTERKKEEKKIYTPAENQIGFNPQCFHRKPPQQCMKPKLTSEEKLWWGKVRRGTSKWAERAWPNKSEKLCFNIHNFSRISAKVYGENLNSMIYDENLFWSLNLIEYERAVFSLAGSDGILEETFRKFGVTNKKFLEIGTGKNAIQCNTRYLREVYGWTGVMLDKKAQKESIGLFRHTANTETICSFIISKKVPFDLDLFSLDIDGIDYHILNAILECGFKPRVIVAEYNPQFGPLIPAAAPNDAKVVYGEGEVMGAAVGSSLFALVKLMDMHGYSLYYCDRHGLDSYFIRQEVLQNQNLALQLWSTILFRFPAYREHIEEFENQSFEKLQFF